MGISDLAKRLLALKPGDEFELDLDRFLALFGSEKPLLPEDLNRVHVFAATHGCQLEWDVFGHFNPIFRRAESRPGDREP